MCISDWSSDVCSADLGYDPQSRRAASADAFEDALESQACDVILCDYTMPGFSGVEALALLHKRKLDIPFIFVSGTLSEEMAVAAMRAGAHDYIVKEIGRASWRERVCQYV